MKGKSTIHVGPALIELAAAYDRRTRLLLIQHADEAALDQTEYAHLIDEIFPTYLINPTTEKETS